MTISILANKTLRPMLVTLIYCTLSNNLAYAKAKSKYFYNSTALKVSLSPVPSEKVAAFYEGRGFSKEMVNTLKQKCFITIGIRNKSNNIILHDLSNWTYSNKNSEIKRIDREQWKLTWKKMNIPLSHQSTFRWTLLPEKLDFRSGEHEAGNITLPFSDKPFSLNATFTEINNKVKKNIYIKIQDIHCAK